MILRIQFFSKTIITLSANDEGFKIIGNYAYVKDNSNYSVRKYDISNPTVLAPLVDTLVVANDGPVLNILHFDVMGDYLFVATQRSTGPVDYDFRIYNYTTKAKLFEIISGAGFDWRNIFFGPTLVAVENVIDGLFHYLELKPVLSTTADIKLLTSETISVNKDISVGRDLIIQGVSYLASGGRCDGDWLQDGNLKVDGFAMCNTSIRYPR